MPKKKTNRGSPEAIEKRKVARMFNDMLGAGPIAKLDGRTEKRRQRLLKELEAGSAHGGRGLKPLDVLNHVTELLAIGEPLGSLRKARKPPKPLPVSKETVELVQRLHKSYGFPRQAYRFVGIGDDTLKKAGISEKE